MIDYSIEACEDSLLIIIVFLVANGVFEMFLGCFELLGVVEMNWLIIIALGCASLILSAVALKIYLSLVRFNKFEGTVEKR